MPEYNKPYDRQSAYEIYSIAAENIRKRGFFLPYFKKEDIKEKEGKFYLEFDFNIIEERNKGYGKSVPRLAEEYNRLIGEKNINIPDKFVVYLGEKYSDENPRPITKQSPLFGSRNETEDQKIKQIEKKDEYGTYCLPYEKEYVEIKRKTEKDDLWGTY